MAFRTILFVSPVWFSKGSLRLCTMVGTWRTMAGNGASYSPFRDYPCPLLYSTVRGGGASYHSLCNVLFKFIKLQYIVHLAQGISLFYIILVAIEPPTVLLDYHWPRIACHFTGGTQYAAFFWCENIARMRSVQIVHHVQIEHNANWSHACSVFTPKVTGAK